MINVILADDQSRIRGHIALLLAGEADITVVAEVGDGLQAVEQTRLLQPDVVVMDVRMPGMDGVEATRLITRDEMSKDPGKTIRVLILTMFHIDETVFEALRNGASGFMLKHSMSGSLIEAVKAIATGEAWLDPTVTRPLIDEFAARPHPGPWSRTDLEQLTAREREVLWWVAQGLSNTEVAIKLSIAEVTVKTHVARVLMKLGVRDRAQAVAVAYQSGLVKVGEH
ncbi:response regulator [Nonomuraea insulae]|uniref:Response regulator n=1 Tax=Nonomuraea insulae TaxID=1616787 RepID=A0ABW1CGN1_9ACTN